VASRLDRPLAARRSTSSVRHLVQRIAAVLLVLALVALLVSRIDFTHDLHRMHVRVLSGAPEGNYHALVARLAERAAPRHGVVENLTSAGSAENVKRLAASAASCDVAFALSQDGLDWDPSLRLVGRLSKAESVLFLAKDGDEIHEFADLNGLRIGAGPVDSGADRIARQIFTLPDFAPLGVVLSNHPLDEQLRMAARGDLDVALVVIDADAPLVEEWVARRGLQIASFAHTEGVARRLPHLRAGHIGAGTYDSVRNIPKADKSVMKVETLVLGNGCASRIASMDFLELLAAEFPDFVRHNKEAPNTSSLAMAPAATDFFANDGPQLADEYVPWLVEVMPPANWAYVVMAVSLLFNAMGFGHRFRLWRIDATRVKLEGELANLFPPATTLGDIDRIAPDPSFTKSETTAAIDHVVKDLEDLAARSRRYSLSVLVPMGQEMAYRYQEGVIYETLAVLRAFRRRVTETPS
jgi:TRAP-type uncharacterized transport system substrate-binding protein